MQTTINYRLQDDIIGRAGRRLDSKHKADKALLEFTSTDASHNELDVGAEKVTRELGARLSGKDAGGSKEEEAKKIIADAKMLGPRDIVRVMQANTRNPFVQARGCAAISEIASFSMRNRHSRTQGMFTFRRGTEVSPTANMNVQLGKTGALTCVLQALVKHRANKQVVWRATWACQQMIKSSPNKHLFLKAGGVSTVKNVQACHEGDKDLQNELLNLLILVGAETQTMTSQWFDGPVDTSKPAGCYHRGCALL